MKNNMIDGEQYIKTFATHFPTYVNHPWNIPANLEFLVKEKIKTLNDEYVVSGDIAIHNTARIEEQVIMKGAIIVGPHCFIGAHAYLRGGIFLDERVVVGPGCEVKSSVLFCGSALAHFNFVGDSVVGAYINMEAGSVIANHYNERNDKSIFALIGGNKVKLPVTKFGALVGDSVRIGANAVLSPGSILEAGAVVGRLQLVEQVKNE